MALWGLHFVVIRIGALEIPPLLLLSLRFSLCGLIFIPFASKINISQFKNLVLYVLPFQIVHMLTLFLGLAQVDAGLAALIIQVELPFLVLLGLVFYKERFGLITMCGLLITFTGGILLVYNPHTDSQVTMFGVILLVISAFTWAVGSVRLKYISELNFPTMAGYAFGMATPVIATLSLLVENDHINALQQADHLKLGAVLGYQVIIISLSHYWWKNLMGRNPVYKLTPFTVLTPIFGVIFSMLIMGEKLSMTTTIGGAIALMGVAIVTLRKAKKADPIPSEVAL